LVTSNNQSRLLGLWITPQGKQRLEALQPWQGLEILERLDNLGDRHSGATFKQQIAQAWQEYDGLIFCMAVGAVVRLIAPYLQHKAIDPAVVVIDDRGKFVISLCGGHLGGGDRLTREIAARLDAQAVITTASAGLNLPGVDVIGSPFGWQRGEGDWTAVSAAVAKQAPVQVWQEAGSRLWQSHLPDDHPFKFHNSRLDALTQITQGNQVDQSTQINDLGRSPQTPTVYEKTDQLNQLPAPDSTHADHADKIEAVNVNGIDRNHEEYQARIWISVRDWRSVAHFTSDQLSTNQPANLTSPGDTNHINDSDRTQNPGDRLDSTFPDLSINNPALPPNIPTVQWHPRLLWIGIGCERGVSAKLIDLAVSQTLQKYGLAKEAIAGLASIDLKADEAGLLAFAHSKQLPLKFFSADQLKNIAVPNPSAVVAQEVGTPSVAEAAALSAAQQASQIVIAPDLQSAPPNLLVTKQIVRDPTYTGAVTVAIAQANLESIDKPGQLYLVGIGPGSLDQITPAAKQAIAKADAIIGYGLYIDLIEPLLNPGQIVETYAITKERQRADRAVDLAQWGLSVAVISSGDCGIYGMAGLVLEALQARNWNGSTPAVEVFPGITALQAAAARVGTPLMHDFCAISLSDLLTPIEVIQKRLVAAAEADFVIALYNPRSQTRTKPMDMALEIFLQHRDRNTPIALVKSAFRANEQVKLTTLGELNVEDVDMFTTVLIGNSRTRFYQEHLITPRSYY
jgi:cobalt-precorrin 5A hydrolase/precorrin-3B C17-methyltransferase